MNAKDAATMKVLDPLNPLLSEDRAKRLPMLAKVSADLVADIAAVGVFSPGTADALRAVDTSGKVEAELLARLERLAQSVRDQKEHRSDHAPYGITRGLFPVFMEGVIVACLDTGPLKLGALRPDQVKELAKVTGLSAKELAPLESCAALDAKQVAGVLRMYKSIAAGFTRTLDETGASGFAGPGSPSGAAASASSAPSAATTCRRTSPPRSNAFRQSPPKAKPWPNICSRSIPTDSAARRISTRRVPCTTRSN